MATSVKTARIQSRAGQRRQGRGARMVLDNTTAIVAISKNLPPDSAIWEVLKNAWEGKRGKPGATRIDIFPNADGHIVIRDNGSGILADTFEADFGKLGRSGKEIAVDRNRGYGAKVTCPVFCTGGFEVVTWCPGEKKARMLVSGIDESDNLLLFEIGVGGAKVKQVAKPAATPSGTQCTLHGMIFDRAQLELSIGNHFPFFRKRDDTKDCEILIHEAAPESKRRVEAPLKVTALLDRAYAARDREMPTAYGVFETPHAVCHWFVLNAKSKSILDSVYEFWNGEVQHSYPMADGGENRLQNYGAVGGFDRLVLIVEMKNTKGDPDITSDLHRMSIEGWKRRSAYFEVSSQMDSCEPLQQYYDAWTRANEENAEKAEDEAVADTHHRWQTPKVKLPAPDGDGEASVEQASGGPEKKASKRPRSGSERPGSARPTSGTPGRPGPRKTGNNGNGNGEGEGDLTREASVPVASIEAKFVGREALGSMPARIIKRTGTIQINRDWPKFSAILEEARKGKGAYKRWIEARALLRAHFEHSVKEHILTTGKVPGLEDGDDSLTTIALSSTVVLQFVRGKKN